jgi:hypothetical protein
MGSTNSHCSSVNSLCRFFMAEAHHQPASPVSMRPNLFMKRAVENDISPMLLFPFWSIVFRVRESGDRWCCDVLFTFVFEVVDFRLKSIAHLGSSA